MFVVGEFRHQNREVEAFIYISLFGHVRGISICAKCHFHGPPQFKTPDPLNISGGFSIEVRGQQC